MDKEKAIKLLICEKACVEDVDGNVGGERVRQAYDMAIEALQDRPTGKWIKAKGVMPPEFHVHHFCSKCGNFANMEPPFGNREDLSEFCPNCGVYMKGDTE